jgi:hypothetical protein
MSLLTWNTPSTISGFTASEARVVIDSNGNATAIWIEQSTYSVGTAGQSGTAITGVGTTFTSSMVGGTITYANGMKASITAFVSATSLTVTESLTVTSQAYTIYYSGIVTTKYLPNGGSWSSSTQLSTIGNNSVTPKMCIDSNGIVSVVWSENTVINYSSYNGTWSSVTPLSSGTGASNPVMCVDGVGNVVVGWVTSAQIQAIVKPISSGIWSSITTFTTTNSDNPSMCINGGTTTIVWHAKPSTQDKIMASTATTVGGAFGTPVDIVGTANTGHMHNYPKVAVDLNGNTIAVWYRSDFGGSTNSDYINVFVPAAILLSGASSWNVPIMLSNLGMRNPADLTVKCGFDPVGNAYVLWTSSSIANSFNIEANIRQISGNLSGSVQIISGNLTAYDTSMSISPLSDILITYMYYDGTDSVIQAVETDIGGYPLNTYTPPSTISTASTNNAHPRGAISLTNSTANVIAVWQSYDSVNNTTIIQAATGSKPLLGAPTDLAVNQTTNNFGVFNEFDNTLSWTASTDPNTIGYNIYRDSIFIAQVDYTTVSFVDRNCAQSGTGTTVTYSIASLDNNFQQSHRVSINIS